MLSLSPRLSAVASLVRNGAAFADIGCDHGFLTVHLLTEGRVRSAIAADIHEGPLSRCRELIKRCSLQHKAECVLCDGLEKVSPDKAEDIAICGMGGEMIVHILESCEWVKDRDKHFIFNPMTHPEILREYLCLNGFEINSDIIVRESSYFYNVFDAYYTGEIKEHPRRYYFLGKINDFSQREYFEHLLAFLRNKEKSGCDYSDVIKYIEARL